MSDNLMLLQKQLSAFSTNSNCTSSEVRTRIDSIESSKPVLYTKEKKKRKMSFKSLLVEVIEVDCWKEYNMDCSDKAYIWGADKPDPTPEKETIKCQCIVF